MNSDPKANHTQTILLQHCTILVTQILTVALTYVSIGTARIGWKILLVSSPTGRDTSHL